MQMKSPQTSIRFCDGYLFQNRKNGKWYWKKMGNFSMIVTDEAKQPMIHQKQ